jgi:hypothetical protein
MKPLVTEYVTIFSVPFPINYHGNLFCLVIYYSRKKIHVTIETLLVL